jgi:hypothetical protein
MHEADLLRQHPGTIKLLHKIWNGLSIQAAEKEFR